MRSILVAMAVAVLVVPFGREQAVAGVIPQHVWAAAYSEQAYTHRDEMLGDTYASAHVYGVGSGNGIQTSEGSASAEIVSNHLFMRLDAHSTNTDVVAWHDPPIANARAGITWSDIAYLAGPTGNVPDRIRIQFTLSGRLSAPENPDFSSFLAYDFTHFGTRDPLVDTSADPIVGVYMHSTGPDLRAFSGMTFDPTTGGISGRCSLLASNDGSGAYPFALIAQVRAWVGGSAGVPAIADFSDTITLSDVTREDGSPLSGFSVSFDSGLRPNNLTVPEPSTLVLWSSLGAIGLVAGWWRRRRAA